MNETLLNFGDWYEFVSELGRGTTGTVYEARDAKLNRQVAIKVPDLSPDNERSLKSRRFMRECRVLAGLTQGSDCNIPTLHAVMEISGQPFSVREFVNGQTLHQCVAEDSIDLRTGLSVISTVARVVQFVHEYGIAHRNLSADNILVSTDWTPWLIGFGQAQAIDDIQGNSNKAVGTPAEVDVQGLLNLFRWLCHGLRSPIPVGLERATSTSSSLTAGVFGEMIASHL